jgi:16S rRNA (cytosine1402-N4)-methyltransferase
MLRECMEGLNIDPAGTYVDATFGGGGHSQAILERLTTGRLLAFDQDADAQAEAAKIANRSFTFCPTNFRYLKRYLRLNNVWQVHGVLADLGVSSHQIDSAGRGFSTRFAGPLDMRMNRQAPTTAADVLNTYTEQDLHKVLGMYGEIRNAKTAASQLVRTRAAQPFRETQDLKKALQPLAPRGRENKYFAQVFQALRMEVNDELKALEEFLVQAAGVLAPGGRLVVMSYHSLEDRMVKNFINTGKPFGELEKDFYGNPIRPLRAVNRKPIEAGKDEVEKNSRARSAKLRIAEREM